MNPETIRSIIEKRRRERAFQKSHLRIVCPHCSSPELTISMKGPFPPRNPFDYRPCSERMVIICKECGSMRTRWEWDEPHEVRVKLHNGRWYTRRNYHIQERLATLAENGVSDTLERYRIISGKLFPVTNIWPDLRTSA